MVESGGQHTVVLLHALPFDSEMWRPVRRQLEMDGAPVVAPNLYRLGSTTAEWATAVLARVTEPSLVLVGCSVGGSCALDIAALVPERIVGMVLIGTKADRRPEPAAHREAVDLLESGGRSVAWDRFWRPLFGSQARPDVVADARAMFDRQTVDELVAGVDAFHTRASRLDVVSELRCPIVFMTGSEDPSPGLDTNRRQVDAAFDGRLEVVEGAGHYLPLEASLGVTEIITSLISTD